MQYGVQGSGSHGWTLFALLFSWLCPPAGSGNLKTKQVQVPEQDVFVLRVLQQRSFLFGLALSRNSTKNFICGLPV